MVVVPVPSATSDRAPPRGAGASQITVSEWVDPGLRAAFPCPGKPVVQGEEPRHPFPFDPIVVGETPTDGLRWLFESMRNWKTAETLR